MSPRRVAATVAAIGVLAGAGAASGCGGNDGGGAGGDASQPARTTAASATAASASAEGAALTEAQALVVARVLQRNYEQRGSVVDGAFTIQGSPIDFAGRIDFRAGRGTIVVHERRLADAPARRYYWSHRVVLAQAKPGEPRYESQAPNPAGDPVHHLIQFLQLLSAKAIDNLEVLRSQDLRIVGRRNDDGRAYDLYRFGMDGTTTYWIDGRGLLGRVDAREASGARTTVRLGRRGAQRITLP